MPRKLYPYLRAKLPFADSADNPVLFISGSGRSGTTWLSEVLSDLLDGRLIFEPFKPGIVGGLSDFGNRQYLRPAEPADAFSEAIDQIIHGRIRHHWTDRYNHAFSYRARIIKEIRTNLIVGWLLARYPDIRVVHLVRNPLSTIGSQKAGGWTLDLQKFLSQPDLMADYLQPFEDLLTKSHDPFERAVLHWAVENYVPVMQQRTGQIPATRFRVFSYDLIRQGDRALGELLSFAGVPSSEIDWRIARRPSRVSRGRTDFSHANDHGELPASLHQFACSVANHFELSEFAGAH